MIRPHRLAPAMRPFLAAALVLCLGLRLVTPAGFMPAFAQGALAIVPCPGAVVSPMQGMAMGHGAGEHRHQGKDGSDQPCPYAAALGMAGLDTGPLTFVGAQELAAVPPVADALPHYRRHATRDRPPAQGPPLPA